MSRTIAVTGGTGFIGGMLLHHLVNAGYRVRALVRDHSAHKLPKLAGLEAVSGSLPVSYTHLTLPTNVQQCRSRWAPDH